MIEWQKATEESLKDIKEKLLVIYLYRDEYIVDVAYPFFQNSVGRTWFVKRDGFAISTVKYWARINLPKDVEEHNDRNA